MASLGSVMAGLTILTKYDNDCEVSAEHDVLYAGSEKTHEEKLSGKDRDSLAELGWHWSESYDSWMKFT